jgi:hypothetical protein
VSDFTRFLTFIDQITEPDMTPEELWLIEEIKRTEAGDYRLWLIEVLCRLRQMHSRWT